MTPAYASDVLMMLGALFVLNIALITCGLSVGAIMGPFVGWPLTFIGAPVFSAWTARKLFRRYAFDASFGVPAAGAVLALVAHLPALLLALFLARFWSQLRPELIGGAGGGFFGLLYIVTLWFFPVLLGVNFVSARHFLNADRSGFSRIP